MDKKEIDKKNLNHENGELILSHHVSKSKRNLYIIFAIVIAVFGLVSSSFFYKNFKNLSQPVNDNQKQLTGSIPSPSDQHASENSLTLLKELGCNDMTSCITVCSKPGNESKCQQLMQSMMSGGNSGFGGQKNVLTNFNPKDVPVITTNPMDIDRIIYLSKFRSDAGHDFSYSAWDGESCRSMKHYFNFSQNQVNGMPVRSTPGPGETNINIYSPFDGVITADLAEKTPIGRQIHIASEKNKAYNITLFHIDLSPGLREGSSVKSGQIVGTIGPKDGTDVAYMAFLSSGKTVYLSIFDYMTGKAFVPYAALGYKRSDFVLTKEQADAAGYKCNGEQFIRQNNYYRLSGGSPEGYIQFRPNPYAR